jgi:hypothetical protein
VHTTPTGTFAPTCAAVRSDGSVVFSDPINNLMRHVDAAGTLVATWPLSISGQGTQNAHGSIHLAADEARVFWTDDGVAGWAWVDSARVINAAHLFPDAVYGDIALTTNEGTLVALPDSDAVAQWPGGTASIRPSDVDPTTFGGEHAHLTFFGAEATLG